MIERILCPFHKEDTPSLVVYDNGFKCFGCGRAGRLSELGRQDTFGNSSAYRKPPEDISKTISYISSLPKEKIRGLDLPSDTDNYYIVWPGNTPYYKRRSRVTTEEGAKYLCPRGHEKPLFILNSVSRSKNKLVVVEGEINAMSVFEACPEIDVASPGGTNEFFSKKTEKYLQVFKQYENILVMVDKDGPGIKAAVELKARLLQYTPFVTTILMEKDANEILTETEGGRQKLREMVMSAWL